MYLHLGQSVMVRNQDIIGIFDLDNTTWSFRTRRFLELAEQEGRVTAIGDDLPRSFVLTQEGDSPPPSISPSLPPPPCKSGPRAALFSIIEHQTMEVTYV